MKPHAALAIAMLCFALHVDGETPQSYLLDPFAQATSGREGCPVAKPHQGRQAVSRHRRVGDDDTRICQLAGMRSQSGAERRVGTRREAPARRRAGVERGDNKAAGKIARARSSAVSKLRSMLLNSTQLPKAWTLGSVVPAKAGIQCRLNERHWVPACAGTTRVRRNLSSISLALNI